MVSLGKFLPTQNGNTNQQTGTFVHELGHTLGLDHGGGDGVNFKPNYFSIMSYTFQTVGIMNNAGIIQFDYSREALPRLDESDLAETRGISDGIFLTQWTNFFGAGGGVGVGPVDWTGTDVDGDGFMQNDVGVSLDLNADNCVGGDQMVSLETTPQVMMLWLLPVRVPMDRTDDVIQPPIQPSPLMISKRDLLAAGKPRVSWQVMMTGCTSTTGEPCPLVLAVAG
jgi:hypothetical protein